MMMKKLFLLIFFYLLLLNAGFAQKLNAYKASNGITYEIGDTVALGVGSSCDGNFEYINAAVSTTILMALAETEDYESRLASGYEGSHVVIRKLKLSNNNYYFTFLTQEEGIFVVDIEAAISNCELAYCQPDGFLSQQQFEKLILLYQACQNNNISHEKFVVLRKEMVSPAVDK